LVAPFSDHSIVVTAFTGDGPDAQPRGPGRWIFNSELLKDAEFVLAVETLLGQLSEATDDALFETWSAFKTTVRGIALRRSLDRASKSKRRMLEIRKEMRGVERLLAREPSCQAALERLQSLKSEEERLMEASTRSMRIRSKARWAEDGEKNSKYFYSLVKAKARRHRMEAVVRADGSVARAPAELCEEVSNYFAKIISADASTERAQEAFLVDSIRPEEGPSGEMWEVAGALLTKAEIAHLIDQSPRSKSPGPDGLTFEFYRHFAALLTPILARIYRACLSQRRLPADFSTGDCKLLFKGKGDVSSLDNWRPITLLNADCKLLTKWLANRIQTVAPQLIHESQTGFIRGRSIKTNLMSVLFVKSVYRQIALERGARTEEGLLFLDQSKAYDRVSWRYLDQCLRFHGFPDEMREWIMLFYRRFSVSFFVNGFESRPVGETCGLRQGDPLSPILYNLTLEPLLSTIRQRISGLVHPYFDAPFKVSAFADDTCVAYSTRDAQAIIQSFDEYSAASNAKVNYAKSVLLPLSPGVPAHTPFHVAGEGESFTYLGLVLTRGSENWKTMGAQMIEKVERTIASWRPRVLSLRSRVRLVKACLFSKLYYVAGVLAVPDYVVRKIRSLALKYIWAGKGHKLSVDVISLPTRCGGLDLTDLGSQCCAILGSTLSLLIGEILNPGDSPWWARSAIKCAGAIFARFGMPSSAMLGNVAVIQSIKPLWKSLPFILQLIIRSLSALPIAVKTIDGATAADVGSLPAISPFTSELLPEDSEVLIRNGIGTIGKLVLWNEARTECRGLDAMHMCQIRQAAPRRSTTFSTLYNQSIYAALVEKKWSDPNSPLSRLATAFQPTALTGSYVVPSHLVALPRTTWSNFQAPTHPSRFPVDVLLAGEAPSKYKTAVCRRSLQGPLTAHLSRLLNRLDGPQPHDLWSRCASIHPQRHSDILWLALHDRLPVPARIARYNPDVPSTCPACNLEGTVEHILFECLSAPLWRLLANVIRALGQHDYGPRVPAGEIAALLPALRGGVVTDNRLKMVLEMVGILIHLAWVSHCDLAHGRTLSSNALVPRACFRVEDHMSTLAYIASRKSDDTLRILETDLDTFMLKDQGTWKIRASMRQV
jgi:hypothetical protein